MYPNGLEYIVNGSYLNNLHAKITYLSKNVDNNYSSRDNNNPIIFEKQYFGNSTKSSQSLQYQNQKYLINYIASHSFAPEIFLDPSRPKARFVDDSNEVKRISEETFELMAQSKIKDFWCTENSRNFLVNEKLPENISINVLQFEEFKSLHLAFGPWNNGILGFSINGNHKQVFVRENHLDALMLVIGHEIGHVLTDTLSNKHDEEAKAFAFSLEWAKTIKKHNVANLGMNIKEEIDFQPARNGLHDVAFAFVDFMVKKGRKAMELHGDLIKRYISVFDRVY